jgi:hypothetical protein
MTHTALGGARRAAAGRHAEILRALRNVYHPPSHTNLTLQTALPDTVKSEGSIGSVDAPDPYDFRVRDPQLANPLGISRPPASDTTLKPRTELGQYTGKSDGLFGTPDPQDFGDLQRASNHLPDMRRDYPLDGL